MNENEIVLVSLNDFETLMTPSDCDIRISTRKIAEHFDKKHKNVIRDIEKAECSQKFSRLNFEPISYKDSYGRSQKEYLITEKGFNFIVLAYNGKKAAEYREAYIEAFDKLKKYYISKQKSYVRVQNKQKERLIAAYEHAGKTRKQIQREMSRDYKEAQQDTLSDLCSIFNV